MKKKVLILSSVASMIEQFTMPKIELLLSMGYEVQVACNFKEGNTISDDQVKTLKNKLDDLSVEHHQIDFSRNVLNVFANLKAYRQVKKITSLNKFSFIHCHSPIGGVCGRLIGKETATKVIYTAHGFHFYTGAPLTNWLIFYPIEKLLAKYTDLLITINEEDYKRAKKRFKAKSIEYVPGVGLDIKKFSTTTVDRERKRYELGVPNKSFMLVSVGELNNNKNHETVIKALAQLKNADLSYVICGKGPLKKKLVHLTKELNVEKQVVFLGYRRDITEIFKASDVFVFPSFREGLSVALMEAMASGLPVVASNIRGNSDLIDDGKGGYLVDPTNAESFSEKINTLFVEEKLRGQFVQHNKNVIKNFSIENVVSRMRVIYNKI